MNYRIPNETNFNKCFSERRVALGYSRRQQIGRIRHRFTIEKHQIKYIQGNNI